MELHNYVLVMFAIFFITRFFVVLFLLLLIRRASKLIKPEFRGRSLNWPWLMLLPIIDVSIGRLILEFSKSLRTQFYEKNGILNADDRASKAGILWFILHGFSMVIFFGIASKWSDRTVDFSIAVVIIVPIWLLIYIKLSCRYYKQIEKCCIELRSIVEPECSQEEKDFNDDILG